MLPRIVDSISARRSVCGAAIGLALVVGYSAPAAADPVQASKPPAYLSQLPTPVAMDPPPIPEEVEAGHTILDGMLECDKMAARLLEMKKLEANLEKASGFLDKLGTVMTAYSVAQHANDFRKTGDIDGLVDDSQGFIGDGYCALLGPYCAVHKAGAGLGTIISYAPKVFGWTDETLNDMWTGYWADVTTGTTKSQLERKIAEFRAKIDQAKRDAAAAEARNAQCRAAPKPTAVDELLQKSKPVAASSSNADLAAALPRRSGNRATARLAEGTSDTDLAARQQERASASQAIDAERSRINGNANNLLGAITSVAIGAGQAYSATSQQQQQPQTSGKCIASADICHQIETGVPAGYSSIEDYRNRHPH